MSVALDAYCSRFGLAAIELRLARAQRTLVAHRSDGGLRHRDRDPQIIEAIADYEAHVTT